MDNQLELEREFLGACMVVSDPTSARLGRALSKVNLNTLCDQEHRKILKVIKKLFNKRQEITPLSVHSILTDQPLSKFIELAANTTVYTGIELAAQNLSNLALERFSIQKLHDCIELIKNSDEGSIADRVVKVAATWGEVPARMQQRDSKLVSLQDCVDDVLTNVYENMSGSGRRGYSSPFDSLNKILAPKLIPHGSLFIVGGLPKMGKTKVLTAFINHHMATYKNERTVIFSLEMNKHQMAERSLAAIGDLDSGYFASYERDDKKLDELGKARDTIEGYDCWINDRAGITIDDIELQCRQLATEKKIGMIAVDYLTLMTPPKADRNDLAYGVITKRLKGLAKELDCYVLLLTQLNRGIMNRSDKRPYPQDSRDTGQIEQDCDFWLGVHKQSVFEGEGYRYKNIVELILRLNRHGNTGTIYLSDMGPYFKEYDRVPIGYLQPKEKEEDGIF